MREDCHPRKTFADLDREAKAVSDDVARLVVDSISYIDTLSIWIPKQIAPGVPGPTAEEIIEEIISSGYAAPTSRPDKFRRNTKPPKGYQRKVTLQRPTEDGLQYLEQRLAGRYLISRLHVALDLCTASQSDAEAVWKFIDAHMVKLYHRDKHIRVVAGQTKYHGRHRARNNLVVYAHWPSKVTGSPCCHVEWRSACPAAVRQVFRKGLRGKVTLPEIVALDHRQYWADRLSLIYPHLEAVAMRWNGNSYRKASTRRDRLLAELLGRSTQGVEYVYNMQELVDGLRSVDRAKVMRRVDNSVFLPPGPLINCNMLVTPKPTTGTQFQSTGISTQGANARNLIPR